MIYYRFVRRLERSYTRPAKEKACFLGITRSEQTITFRPAENGSGIETIRQSQYVLDPVIFRKIWYWTRTRPLDAWMPTGPHVGRVL